MFPHQAPKATNNASHRFHSPYYPVWNVWMEAHNLHSYALLNYMSNCLWASLLPDYVVASWTNRFKFRRQRCGGWQIPRYVANAAQYRPPTSSVAATAAHLARYGKWVYRMAFNEVWVGEEEDISRKEGNALFPFTFGWLVFRFFETAAFHEIRKIVSAVVAGGY